MPESLTLCLCCLESGATPVEVGPDIGTQREPHRETVDLCETCKSALLHADFATLADRQADKRTVLRPGFES